MISRIRLFIYLCILSGFAQCNSDSENGVARDESITVLTAFNNLFLDSTQLAVFLNTKEITEEAERQSFISFYRHRNYQYAWFDSSGLAEQASNFVNLQQDYIQQVGDSSLKNKQLQQLIDTVQKDDFAPADNEQLILQTELELTYQFFKYATAVYKGSNLNTVDLGWFIPRKKVNIEGTLDSLIAYKGKEAHKYEPLNPQFRQLQEQVHRYESLRQTNSWAEIPMALKGYRMGDTATAIAAIKQRLHLLQDFAPTDTSLMFTEALKQGVSHFQKRHGLLADGIVGKNVLSELNTPLNERIQQLLINMERFRWMPPQPDSVYLLVNIPEYKLHAFENQKQSFEMNVIVGAAATNTIIFSDKLQFVVFSPYWNVPESITKNEIMPAMRRNSNYLARNNMEITGYNGSIPYVRQKPGGNNSLGRVKFLFPNQFNIYLHDTPFKGRFAANARPFSHGCIRLEHPKDLAKFLLRNQQQWNDSTITAAMHLDKEKWVTLQQSIPVFITYFTAWVDEDGDINFRNDIYGHDKKMAEKLFSDPVIN